MKFSEIRSLIYDAQQGKGKRKANACKALGDIFYNGMYGLNKNNNLAREYYGAAIYYASDDPKNDEMAITIYAILYPNSWEYYESPAEKYRELGYTPSMLQCEVTDDTIKKSINLLATAPHQFGFYKKSENNKDSSHKDSPYNNIVIQMER